MINRTEKVKLRYKWCITLEKEEKQGNRIHNKSFEKLRVNLLYRNFLNSIHIQGKFSR